MSKRKPKKKTIKSVHAFISCDMDKLLQEVQKNIEEIEKQNGKHARKATKVWASDELAKLIKRSGLL